MKEIKLSKIEINGTEYPIYCDLNVLDLIQENFESVNEFERGILGLVPLRDKDGELMRDDTGALLQEQHEPKIKTVAFGLFVMIREGQRIQKRKTGEDVELIQKEDIMEGCRTSFIELAEIVREEFNKCFAIKKKENKTSKSKKS
jgi:hypothetical protein